MTTQTKPITFNEWKALASKVNAIAKRLQDAHHEKGWKLAASVGIPRDMCCLHNASIDDELKGWCAGNDERYKVANQAKHILDDWSISHKAQAIISRAWDRVTR